MEKNFNLNFFRKECLCNKDVSNQNQQASKDSRLVMAHDDKVAFINPKNQHNCCCTPPKPNNKYNTETPTFRSYT